MHFNPLHQSMITKSANIKRSHHLVNMIKLTPVSPEMTPAVINFSIKGGRCDSHANRGEWQRGRDNFGKLTRPQPQRRSNHIIRLWGKHCSLKKKKTTWRSAVCRHTVSTFADVTHFIRAMHLHIVMNFFFFSFENSFQISQVSY